MQTQSVWHGGGLKFSVEDEPADSKTRMKGLTPRVYTSRHRNSNVNKPDIPTYDGRGCVTRGTRMTTAGFELPEASDG